MSNPAIISKLSDYRQREGEPDEDESLESANVGCANADDAVALMNAAHKSEERYAIAANPPKPHAIDIYKEIIAPSRLSKKKITFTAKELGLTVPDLFSTSAKLVNSSQYGWWTPGLYLASGEVAQTGEDLCIHASNGCRMNCLFVSGQREMWAATALAVQSRLLEGGPPLGDPTNLSLLRTYLRKYGREEFDEMLIDAIEREEKKAKKQNLSMALRLNATSDIPWEAPVNRRIIEKFPDMIFYDYTKIPQRVMAYRRSRAPENFDKITAQAKPDYIQENPEFPENYYLNFSYSEINLIWCLIMLKMGANVVIPFDNSLGKEPWVFATKREKSTGKAKSKDRLPTHFLGHPVIDGDAYDMRFIDNTFWREMYGGKKEAPYIVGLRIKGNFQKKNKNDFFFSAKEAENQGDNPLFIADQVFHNTQTCLSQGKKNLLPSLSLVEQHLSENIVKAFKEALKG